MHSITAFGIISQFSFCPISRYTGGDEEEDKDAGWKHIYSDVFKCPPYTSLFCAVLGAGTQLLTV